MSGINVFLGVLIAVYAFGAGWFIAFFSRGWWHQRHAIIDATASPTLRFCRDCRWASAPPGGFFGTARDFSQAKCMHPSSVRSSGDFLATGRYSPDNAHYCSVVRQHSGPDNCGETGMHWELRDRRTPTLISGPLSGDR
jgi:hypothetical protein